MRTTITLDDDLFATLKQESRESGRSFKDLVNDCLRTGYSSIKREEDPPPFKLPKIGLRIDRPYVTGWDLIEELEGPFWR